MLLTDKETGLTAANVAAAAATGVAGSVACEPLDWAAADAWLAAREGVYDVILGADIVYHQQHDFRPVQHLAALLAALLARAPSARVLFGYQERDGAARLTFWAALAAHGLGVTQAALEELPARGVDTRGLSGPMVLWWIAPGRGNVEMLAAAPAEDGADEGCR